MKRKPREIKLSPESERNPIVQSLREQGKRVTRQNYLDEAGYAGEPDPESEATFPPELQNPPLEEGA
jgi:hypothetical protein